MNSFPPTGPAFASALPKLGAALEVLGYLAAVAAATSCYLLGWLTCEGAEVLTALMLVSLIGLAWKRFDGGRHPCFFFLCTLTLFQAGQLLAYCAGEKSDIFQVTLLTWYQFGLSRNVTALALLSIALSALCLYAPCRWNYRYGSPPGNQSSVHFLPYFYVLFWLSVPVQLFKNYRYYEYAKDHGGYLVLFLDHGGLASSIPVAVRAISLISLPAFVGIFVLESRKRFLRAATALYFLIAAPVLLLGSRGAIFSLALTLWYVAKIKSARRARLYAMGLAGVGLILVGVLIGSLRNENGGSHPLDGPAQFLASQGASLSVTEVAIAYRSRFAPHTVSYLASELRSAFDAPDQANYTAGKRFADDVSMFLNPIDYQLGRGTGSAYLAEAYVAGGLWAVVLVSGLLGAGLHGMYRYGGNPLGLFLVAMILPEVLFMPRGGLVEWISVSARVGISVVVLVLGWWLYQSLARMGCAWWQNSCALDLGRQELGMKTRGIQERSGGNA